MNLCCCYSVKYAGINWLEVNVVEHAFVILMLVLNFHYVYCRICFCTADRMHEKVFAYIARNRDNETMECHAFLCSKRKIVRSVFFKYVVTYLFYVIIISFYLMQIT